MWSQTQIKNRKSAFYWRLPSDDKSEALNEQNPHFLATSPIGHTFKIEISAFFTKLCVCTLLVWVDGLYACVCVYIPALILSLKLAYQKELINLVSKIQWIAFLCNSYCFKLCELQIFIALNFVSVVWASTRWAETRQLVQISCKF